MKLIWAEPGKYIVAVSGGVDSMCLFDLLVNHNGYDLVVAHADHGIRGDGDKDRLLVEAACAQYGITCVTKSLQLNKDSSEETARLARYKFLFEVMRQHEASAVITAHHADDVLETSILNVRRGTDRYGAAGGMTRQGIVRPLINVSKQELLDYAQQHKLMWREDTTNADFRYTRNQVRHQVVPTINKAAYRNDLLKLQKLNKKIDSKLQRLVSISKESVTISQSALNALSLREVEVLIAYGLRQACPAVELSQPRIAEAARAIMLGADKISFSITATECIIVAIQ